MHTVIERNYPYPILLETGGDYNRSSFKVECETSLSTDRKSLILKFKQIIDCPCIQRLISENKIKPLVNISQRTFRKSALLENEVKIMMNSLSPNHNLEIMPMLVAIEDFSLEYDESMDIVFSYFNSSFDIKRGQILGYGNFLEIELPTNSKIGSIFTISKLKNKEDIDRGIPYIISLDDNPAIDIKVKPSIYDSFFKLKDTDYTYRKLLYSTFVYPAIQLAILTILQDYDTIKDAKWCVAIVNKINKVKGINIGSQGPNFTKDDVSEYTNIVLETLLEDAFNDLDGDDEK